MSNPSDIREISFSVEERFMSTPQARPNRYGQWRIPSDHPVHEQQKRIREAARAAGAMPVANVAIEVRYVIHGTIVGNPRSATMTILDALEGVAFKERDQVCRLSSSREPENEGQPPFFSVVIKCLERPFDTL